MHLSLLLCLIQLSYSSKIGIILCGAPKLEENVLRFAMQRYYRMMSDGFRMAHLLEDNGYTVHMLFCQQIVEYFNGNFQSIFPRRQSWMRRDGEDGVYTSVLNTDGIKTMDRASAKELVFHALRSIPLQNGDEIVIYIRSHGLDTGHFRGPTGVPILYSEVVEFFAQRGVRAKFLWLADACFSGHLLHAEALPQLALMGGGCLALTSSDDKHMAYGAWPLLICSRFPRFHLVMTSSLFRHHFVKLLHRGVRKLADVVEGLHRHCPYAQGVRFGDCSDNLNDWISNVAVANSGSSSRPKDVKHYALSVAKRKAVQHKENWIYGTFYWSGELPRALRVISIEECHGFQTLLEGAARLLGLSLEVPAPAITLTDEQLNIRNHLVESMPDYCYISDVAFYPCYRLLDQFAAAKSEYEIFRAFSNVSASHHLASPIDSHGKRTIHSELETLLSSLTHHHRRRH